MGQELGQAAGRASTLEIGGRIANPPPALLAKYTRKEREFFFDYASFILKLLEDRLVRRRLSGIFLAEGIRIERQVDLRVMVFPARSVRGRPDRMLHGSYNHSSSQISLYPLKLPREWVRGEGFDLFKVSLENFSSKKKRLLFEISYCAISTLVHEVLHLKFESRGLVRYVEEALVRKLERQYMQDWADDLSKIVVAVFGQNGVERNGIA